MPGKQGKESSVSLAWYSNLFTFIGLLFPISTGFNTHDFNNLSKTSKIPIYRLTGRHTGFSTMVSARTFLKIKVTRFNTI